MARDHSFDIPFSHGAPRRFDDLGNVFDARVGEIFDFAWHLADSDDEAAGITRETFAKLAQDRLVRGGRGSPGSLTATAYHVAVEQLGRATQPAGAATHALSLDETLAVNSHVRRCRACRRWGIVPVRDAVPASTVAAIPYGLKASIWRDVAALRPTTIAPPPFVPARRMASPVAAPTAPATHEDALTGAVAQSEPEAATVPDDRGAASSVVPIIGAASSVVPAVVAEEASMERPARVRPWVLAAALGAVLLVAVGGLGARSFVGGGGAANERRAQQSAPIPPLYEASAPTHTATVTATASSTHVAAQASPGDVTQVATSTRTPPAAATVAPRPETAQPSVPSSGTGNPPPPASTAAPERTQPAPVATSERPAPSPTALPPTPIPSIVPTSVPAPAPAPTEVEDPSPTPSSGDVIRIRIIFAP